MAAGRDRVRGHRAQHGPHRVRHRAGRLAVRGAIADADRLSGDDAHTDTDTDADHVADGPAGRNAHPHTDRDAHTCRDPDTDADGKADRYAHAEADADTAPVEQARPLRPADK